MKKKGKYFTLTVLMTVLVISISMRANPAAYAGFYENEALSETISFDTADHLKEKVNGWISIDAADSMLIAFLQKLFPKEAQPTLSQTEQQDETIVVHTDVTVTQPDVFSEMENMAPREEKWGDMVLSDTYYSQIPILMYHVVEDVPNSNSLFLSPAHFQEHLDYFESAGIHPVTMQQVFDHWENGEKLPEKPIVLAFDDGYRSMYTEVWPRLKEKNWPGVFYIYTQAIGADTNLTREMIQEMAEGGMEIGSHSVNHLDMSIISQSQLTTELVDSKATLEQIIEEPVVSFCYPSGRYNGSVQEAVQAAGYETAVTTQYGVATEDESCYALSRIRISKGDNGKALQEKLKIVSQW